jgi:hypothetical protein
VTVNVLPIVMARPSCPHAVQKLLGCQSTLHSFLYRVSIHVLPGPWPLASCVQQTGGYCWPTLFKVLGVLFLGGRFLAFCLPRRHVGHTNFGTLGFANSIPPYLAYLLAPENLLFQRVRNVCHTPCHNQCASKSSSGRIMAHENSTLGVEPSFYARSHCFMVQ